MKGLLFRFAGAERASPHIHITARRREFLRRRHRIRWDGLSSDIVPDRYTQLLYTIPPDFSLQILLKSRESFLQRPGRPRLPSGCLFFPSSGRKDLGILPEKADLHK